MRSILFILLAIIPMTIFGQTELPDTAEYTFDRKGFHSTQKNEMFYVTSPLFPKTTETKEKRFIAHYPLFFIGYNELSENIAGTSDNPIVPAIRSKSWEWGLTLATVNYGIDGSKTLGISTAIQIINVHNHIADNKYAAYTTYNTTVIRNSGKSLDKSYISYWIWKIPLMIEWQHKIGFDKLSVATGPSFEFHHDERSKYVYKGKTYTETVNLNLKNFRIGWNLDIGYGPLSIYTTISTGALMNTDRAPKCYPFSFGVGVSIW
jgi:hypothetical protein